MDLLIGLIMGRSRAVRRSSGSSRSLIALPFFRVDDDGLPSLFRCRLLLSSWIRRVRGDIIEVPEITPEVITSFLCEPGRIGAVTGRRFILSVTLAVAEWTLIFPLFSPISFDRKPPVFLQIGLYPRSKVQE